MIRTEYMVYEMYPQIKPCLPQMLHFIHSEELRQLYPDLEPKCRDHAICQKYGAVFIIGIGCKLPKDCGNYLDMNLGMANYLAKRYLNTEEGAGTMAKGIYRAFLNYKLSLIHIFLSSNTFIASFLVIALYI